MEKPEAPASLLGSPAPRIPLRWSESFGASGDNVKRFITSGGPYAVIAKDVRNPSYLDTTAGPGTTYHCVGTASNGAGEGSISPEETLTARKPASWGNVRVGGISAAVVGADAVTNRLGILDAGVFETGCTGG